GSWNSGYALLVEDGHLVFDFNHYNTHHILRSTRTLPRGASDVTARLQLTGAGTGATVTLTIDGELAGELPLAATFEFFVAFQGLDVGHDGLSPVREGGRGAF